jgi:hypothetical protein
MQPVGARFAGNDDMRERSFLLGIFCVALAGCAGAPEAKVPELRDAPVVQRIDRGPTSMEAEIGGMNEEAVEAAFNSLAGGVQRCLEEGSSKLGQMGGEFKLKLRVDRGGAARWVYLSSSTLGDRPTEKCVLDQARAKSWPRPVGGEGIAEKTFSIDPIKNSLQLEERRAKIDIARARAEAARCKRGIPGNFQATAYVLPDGRVASAGVAPPNEDAESASDCVVDAIRKVRFRSGGGRDAKVIFEI